MKVEKEKRLILKLQEKEKKANFKVASSDGFEFMSPFEINIGK